MSQVVFNISVSLDGFIAGPNDGPGNGMGNHGEKLHDWMFGRKTERDARILHEIYEKTGAIVIGRRMFDNGEAPWGDNPPFHMPVFVLTHRPQEARIKKGGTTYFFVADGIESALGKAAAAAGARDVGIWGGADVARQYIDANLVDEMQIHLVPILIGEGIRLFNEVGGRRAALGTAEIVETPAATHFKFRIDRPI